MWRCVASLGKSSWGLKRSHSFFSSGLPKSKTSHVTPLRFHSQPCRPIKKKLPSNHTLLFSKRVRFLAPGVWSIVHPITHNELPTTTLSGDLFSESCPEKEVLFPSSWDTWIKLFYFVIIKFQKEQWGGVKTVARAFSLLIRFSPLFFSYPLTYFSESFENIWNEGLYLTFCYSGPCFIKLGQWMAMRPDIFSRDLCSRLQKLHHQAPEHSYKVTRDIITASLGIENIEDIFIHLDKEPLASGSIAQIHRGTVALRKVTTPESEKERKEEDEERRRLYELDTTHSGFFEKLNRRSKQREVWRSGMKGEVKQMDVVVKVVHPGVWESAERDLRLLLVISQIADFTGFMPSVSLYKSMMNFRFRMLNQTDMVIEGKNLFRFRENFWDSQFKGKIHFPTPLYPLTSDVLIMSHENAITIREFYKKGTLGSDSFRKKTATLGVQMFLKMLMSDNFLHCDLHPGNLFVRTNRCKCSSSSSSDSELKCNYSEKCDPQLVVFDVGLVLSLNSREVHNLIDLFEAFAKKDFEGGACLLIERHDGNHNIPVHLKERFKVECSKLFSRAVSKKVSEIPLGSILFDLMLMCRKYQVRLENNFATLIVGLLVVEGLGREIASEFNFLEESLTAIKYMRKLQKHAKE